MLKYSPIRSVFYYTYFFFVFFPYISIINLETDSQPWAILFSIFILFFFKLRFYELDLHLGLVAIFSLLLIIISNNEFNSIRSIVNYLSLFFVAHATYLILKTRRISIDKIIKCSVVVWLAAGLMQKLIDKNLFGFLLPSIRTTENRGVVGLAPEPTFYGIVLIFFALYLSHLETKNKYTYIALCIFGIFALAQSSMAILFIAVFAFFFLLVNFKIKYFLAFFAVLIAMPFVLEFAAPESRMFVLVDHLISEPETLLFIDASINDRFFHIFFSLKGLFDGYLLPHGYSEWLPYVKKELYEYSDVVIVEWFSLGGRIMSGYGSAFFELGIIAMIIPFSLTWLLWRLYKDNKRKFFFYTLSVNTMLFSAIPIGFSLFSFYFGFLYFLIKNKNHKSIIKPRENGNYIEAQV